MRPGRSRALGSQKALRHLHVLVVFAVISIVLGLAFPGADAAGWAPTP
ncbi:MAG: hypothetical protein ACLT98_05190 [Eggerthellaceae bacterium]